MGIALGMTLVFAYLFAFPYRRMRIATGYENWRWASAEFSQVRKLMALNLALGVATLLVASAGPFAVIPGIAALIELKGPLSRGVLACVPASAATVRRRPQATLISSRSPVSGSD